MAILCNSFSKYYNWGKLGKVFKRPLRVISLCYFLHVNLQFSQIFFFSIKTSDWEKWTRGMRQAFIPCLHPHFLGTVCFSTSPLNDFLHLEEATPSFSNTPAHTNSGLFLLQPPPAHLILPKSSSPSWLDHALTLSPEQYLSYQWPLGTCSPTSQHWFIE